MLVETQASSHSEDWRRLWAKTDKGSDRWHALPCHLLDVAATAEALWDSLPHAARAVPLLLDASPKVCRKAVVFLAAAHDVGKANVFFQTKDARRAQAMGIQAPYPEPAGHGQATGAFLAEWLKERWGWKPMAATNVARAVGGHHGAFFVEGGGAKLHLDEEPWSRHGPTLLDQLAALLHLPGAIPEPKDLNPFLGWLAGFVCVADWLGSHERMTVFQEDAGDLRTYLQEARERAGNLFSDLGWIAPPRREPRRVEELVPEGRPNELQRLAEQIGTVGFSLALVEAPTGEGKTEAAFALAEPYRSAGGGLCFLLPTMATANGLHSRVGRYIGDDVRLAHSQAWLYRQSHEIVDNPGDDDSRAEAEDWFAGAKRALLAPYGVGTIDQGLIGALRVKHGFVRLFALAGKTVVVDEVHAYDVYMSDLLDVLLGWLRVLGCRVVLLSATLPANRRAALMKAWGVESSEPARYPCITWVDDRGNSHSETFAVAHRKPLGLKLLPPADGEAWARGAARILELVCPGGTGALILNTVGAAQSAYEWLKVATEGTGIEVMVFHARYTADDRRRKEQETLDRFGKTAKRSGRTILVATQVVEQSLDLDFDYMVSALAPIDLLIQRAGRLHRHARRADGSLAEPGERDARPAPVLEVLPPDYDEEDVPDVREPVYARDVQMLTERLLRSGLVIDSPNRVAEAIHAVYGSLDLESMQTAWAARFAEASEREDTRRERMADFARRAVVPSASGRVPLTDKPPLMLDDDTPGSDIAAKTRLEDLPSLTLALLTTGDPDPGQKPSRADKERIALRCVRVSAAGKRYAELAALPTASGWRKVKAIREARPILMDPQGRFRTDTYIYYYDEKIGLRWISRDAELQPCP